METYRVVGIANEALRRLGAVDPSRHIVVVQGPPVDKIVPGRGYQTQFGMMDSMSTILIKRSPFSPDELAKLTEVSRRFSFRPLWLPGEAQDPTLTALFAARGSAEFYKGEYERLGLDFSPVTDDRPFFFDMVRPVDFPRMRARFPMVNDLTYGRLYVGINVLYQILIAMVIVVLLLLGGPLLLKKGSLRWSASTANALAYFVCLGLGFMGVELGLIQKFTLFLGHPVYSLVVLLGSILLFSGIGSLSARNTTPDRGPARIRALVLILVVYAVAVTPLTNAMMASPFAIKCLVAMLLSAIPSFFMGMLFPLGIAAVRERRGEIIPWAWGVNSGFSVLGATLSLFVSMSWGYTVAWSGFAIVYLLSSLCLQRMAAEA